MSGFLATRSQFRSFSLGGLFDRRLTDFIPCVGILIVRQCSNATIILRCVYSKSYSYITTGLISSTTVSSVKFAVLLLEKFWGNIYQSRSCIGVLIVQKSLCFFIMDTSRLSNSFYSKTANLISYCNASIKSFRIVVKNLNKTI